jgi:hypothetical protein
MSEPAVSLDGCDSKISNEVAGTLLPTLACADGRDGSEGHGGQWQTNPDAAGDLQKRPVTRAPLEAPA